MSRRRFDVKSLKNLVKAVMETQGLSPDKAQDVANVLLEADRMGIESHGILRLGMYMQGMKLGRINPTAEISLIRETPVSGVIDANDGMGQPAAIKAMRLAISKAKKSGIGMVVVRNSNHFGIGGYYSMMAAREGLMGLVMTNSEAMVVPTFGRRAMMGTNPIALTMPANPVWFHFDIATSVVPAGKIEVYARNNQPLPEGWSVGSDGQINTDPETFLKIRKEKLDGGLLPIGGFGTTFGGHKGYAISLMVELMTGVFAGGCTSNHVREVPNVDKCCHMFMAIDYSMFGDQKEIEGHFSTYLNEIRDSAKAAGHERISTQGEVEEKTKRRVDWEGVAIHDKSLQEIMDIATECGVDYETIMVEKKPVGPEK
ncbi:MAG: Ldh family oxidoreductase [Planctomycetaceae bacterium]|nr:Ldh family oxidoreductase [Planctomycetaceae bacterium]